MTRPVALLAFALLLVVTAVLYTSQLAEVPAYLMHDEVNFALQAQAIGASAHDTNGRLLPVYFSEDGFAAGRDPIMIYVSAIWLAVRPLSDSAARLPTALTGVLSVVLMFLVGRRLFRSDAMAIVAAGLLALTPAHFVNTRLALSITYPIPFILLWLWCLLSYLSSGDRRLLFGGGLALGVGVYAYVAGLFMMPLYLVFTVLIVRRDRHELASAAVLGFAVAMIPLVWWQFEHPDRYRNLLEAYQVRDAAAAASFPSRIAAYWMFFNPDYLFLSGDARLTNSTRVAGLFPLSAAILIPVGLCHLWRGRASTIGWCVLAGFLTAPLATAISGRLEINRVLYAVPFGVLVAAFGVTALLSSRWWPVRLVTVALLIGVVGQFGLVYAHYLNEYRVSSAPYFGGDARGAVEEVLARVKDGPVFLDSRTPIERYWRFYALAHAVPGLVGRPTYYDQELFSPSVPPIGALLVCTRGDRVCAAVSSQAEWRRVAARPEPDGSIVFEVFEKGQSE